MDGLVADVLDGEVLDHRSAGGIGHDALLAVAHREADQPPVRDVVEVQDVPVVDPTTVEDRTRAAAQEDRLLLRPAGRCDERAGERGVLEVDAVPGPAAASAAVSSSAVSTVTVGAGQLTGSPAGNDARFN